MKKSKTILAIIAISMAISCQTHAEGRHEASVRTDTIRILHYNVGAFRKTETSSVGYIARMARETGASFISLNEVDSCTVRNGMAFQSKEFAEAMGSWNYAFGMAMPYQGGGYGVSIVTAPERTIDRTYVVNLEKGDGREPRALCVAECGDVVFATTHLDHKGRTSQIMQAEKVSSVLRERYRGKGKTVILCGDMNADPSSETMEVFENDWDMVSNPLQFTIPATAPSKCIDYILILKDDSRYEIIKSAVRTDFSSGDVTLASDHLPLEAVIVVSSNR